MKVICTINMKGGVGKTTVSVGTAYELAASFSKKVLLVDIDPQSNASLLILDEERYRDVDKNHKTIADLFSDERGLIGENSSLSLADLIIKNPWNVRKGVFDVIPSSIRLFEKKDLLVNRHFAEEFFEEKLKALSDDKRKYDYVIFDSPPDFDKLVIAALFASNWYIIPVRPDYMSQQGLIVLERKINEIRKHIKSEFLGIVICLKPPTRSLFHKQMVAELKNIYKGRVLAEIAELTVYSEWPSRHRPLRRSIDREPFVEIAQSIINRCEP